MIHEYTMKVIQTLLWAAHKISGVIVEAIHQEIEQKGGIAKLQEPLVKMQSIPESKNSPKLREIPKNRQGFSPCQ